MTKEDTKKYTYFVLGTNLSSQAQEMRWYGRLVRAIGMLHAIKGKEENSSQMLACTAFI
jgi:hypothetical protein